MNVYLHITNKSCSIYEGHFARSLSGTASPPTAPKTGSSSRRAQTYRHQPPARPPTWRSPRQAAPADCTMVLGARSTRSWENSTSSPQRSAAWQTRPPAGIYNRRHRSLFWFFSVTINHMRISKHVMICTAFMEINLWCVVCRLTAEVDSEELSWVQSNVDEVITMLQQSPGLPSIPEVCLRV